MVSLAFSPSFNFSFLKPSTEYCINLTKQIRSKEHINYIFVEEEDVIVKNFCLSEKETENQEKEEKKQARQEDYVAGRVWSPPQLSNQIKKKQEKEKGEGVRVVVRPESVRVAGGKGSLFKRSNCGLSCEYWLCVLGGGQILYYERFGLLRGKENYLI
ncbi:uncharacterized protein HKW66_Vig0058770 [Vigna angularis]|uniref:Uncharacterized protein n=1 Tax=Phaseolus angularis TaxID=3914 RepID=A0A8T0L4X9_PHAAN|nr:uncharacterized protein HKW66_Vig0058770 [Vigna angularis]